MMLNLCILGLCGYTSFILLYVGMTLHPSLTSSMLVITASSREKLPCCVLFSGVPGFGGTEQSIRPQCCRVRRLVDWSSSFFTDFLDANLVGPRNVMISPTNVVWKAPAVGFFKINIDAAVSSSLGLSDVGTIIRDSAGRVLASSVAKLPGVTSSLLAKAWAILKDLLLARDTGIRPVTLDSEAQAVVHLINTNARPLSEIGILLDDIFRLLSACD
ncbi:hypothetical protein Dsin_018203 [Dipteronia sinensis]|uniref:RNase H type-1 domain-containing protein n=1 Tax=Dipteronia sinensis TaxID=43782 RepID=A0AAE0A5F9_9ROSI|nr:hypothetical protein Dsin_018203 [Dipteronia sinensis]